MESTSQLIGALRRSNHRGMVMAQYVVGDLIETSSRHRLYKGRSLIGGRAARIKVIREEYQLYRERLGFLANPYVAELHAAAEVGNDYISRHMEVGTTPAGEHFLIREPTSGSTLADILAERGPMSVPETLSILTDVATAAEGIHALGVGQIDLHPANIALTPVEEGLSWSAQLIDLGGLAYLSQPCEMPPEDLVDRPAWLTPEHATGANLIPSSDMFRLGLLFHLLLAGAHPLPLETATVNAALELLGTDKRLRKSKLRDTIKGLPDEVDMLVDKLLKTSTAERPGNADMLVRGMELVLKEWQALHREIEVPKELWNRIAR